MFKNTRKNGVKEIGPTFNGRPVRIFRSKRCGGKYTDFFLSIGYILKRNLKGLVLIKLDQDSPLSNEIQIRDKLTQGNNRSVLKRGIGLILCSSGKTLAIAEMRIKRLNRDDLDDFMESVEIYSYEYREKPYCGHSNYIYLVVP